MAYTKSGGVSVLACDLCGPDNGSSRSALNTTAALLRQEARRRSGWRRDKLGRDVCPRHPKRKSAR